MSLLPEIPEKLLTEIYNDTTKPGAVEAGKAIGGILGILSIASIPFRLLSGRANIWLEANLERYRVKMSHVNTENVIEPPIDIAVPILEKMAITTVEELAEMFAALLKNSSTLSGIQYVHPNFVNIISSISKDEAVMISDFNDEFFICTLYVTITRANNTYRTPIMGYSNYDTDTRLTFPENSEIYLENLKNLGLLYKSNARISIGNYNELKTKIQDKLNKVKDPDTTRIDFSEQHYGITALGRLFIKGCVAK